jgi:hypothetical protein
VRRLGATPTLRPVAAPESLGRLLQKSPALAFQGEKQRQVDPAAPAVGAGGVVGSADGALHDIFPLTSFFASILASVCCARLQLSALDLYVADRQR